MAKNNALPKEEVFALILKESEDNGDSFAINISRVTGINPSLIAVFDDARYSEIANIERWLGVFAGGGEYLVRVCAMSNVALSIGGGLYFSITGPSKNIIDRKILESQNWAGPKRLGYPSEDVPNMVPLTSHITGTPFSPAPPPFSSYLPPNLANQQTQNNEALIEAKRSAFEANERARQAEIAAQHAERQRIEERHARELREVGQKASADLQELKIALQARPVETTKVSVAEIITAATGVLTPLLATFQVNAQAQAADRRAAEERQAAREDRMNERFNALLAQMNAPSPMVAALATQVQEQHRSLEKMFDSRSTEMLNMSNFAMDNAMKQLELVRAVRELNDGPGESPATAIVREVGQSVAATVAALAQAQVKAPRAPPPFWGPPPMMPPQPQAPQQQAPQQAPQQAQQQQPQSPPPPPQKRYGDVVEMLADMIKTQQDPAQVIGVLEQAIQNNDQFLISQLANHGGDFKALFQAKCGAWAKSNPANMAYCVRLYQMLPAEEAAVEEYENGMDAEGSEALADSHPN